MRKLVLLTIFPLLLCGPLSARAQKDTPASQMPCDKMLKMGAEKYLGLADAQDGSTNGTVQAGARYTECRKQHNLALEGHLPKARQQQIKTVRAALNSLSDTVYGHTIIVEGGGSMYRVMLAYDLADNEDTLAHLIALLQHPGRSGSSDRHRASADMAHASRLFVALKNPHPQDATEAQTDLPAYRTQYADAKAKFAQLQHVVTRLPDSAAALLAHQILMQMKDAFSNAPG